MKTEDLKKAQEAKEEKKEATEKKAEKADAQTKRIDKLEKQVSQLTKTVSGQGEIIDKALASLENIEKAVCQPKPQEQAQPVVEQPKPQEQAQPAVEQQKEQEPVEANIQPKKSDLDMVTYNYIFSYTNLIGVEKFTKSSLKAHKRVNGYGYNYHEAIFYPNGQYVLIERIQDPVLRTLYEDEFDRRVEI